MSVAGLAASLGLAPFLLIILGVIAAVALLAAGIYAVLKLFGKAPSGFRDFGNEAKKLTSSLGGLASGDIPGAGAASSGTRFDAPAYRPSGNIHNGDIITAGRYTDRVSGGVVNLGDHIGTLQSNSTGTGAAQIPVPGTVSEPVELFSDQGYFVPGPGYEGYGTPENTPGAQNDAWRRFGEIFDTEPYQSEGHRTREEAERLTNSIYDSPFARLAIPDGMRGSSITNYNDITINSAPTSDDVVAVLDQYLLQEIAAGDLSQ